MLIGRVGPSPPPWGTSLVVRSHPKERNRAPGLGDHLTDPHTQIAVGIEQLVILTRVTFR
jgi:hypothetical protein